MNFEDLTEPTWFKSSYSSGAGDECLEVALSCHKSSYSGGEGGECVEIAPCPTSVRVRDSKYARGVGPTLTLPAAAWAAFIGLAAR
ncbi:toxin [Streptomyces hygroscopicus]|uniref:DUF397 domain-containing protein n=1 Tax=Streptomyces hygroscopicus TaxID=1912 RepID=UPI00224069D8|nr:DUF397 domain-containing protein [Streptomyces hygroscopicus]MCW7947433.1 toxin [Streptomyces hygroscopicus]